MVGVDDFRSTTQAKGCKANAERRLAKIKKCILPAIVLSALTLLLTKITGKNHTLEIVSSITLIVNLVLLTYAEAWFYIGQLYLLPFRKFGNFFGLIIFLFYFTICTFALLITPIVPLLYEKYLCNVTLECADDLV